VGVWDVTAIYPDDTNADFLFFSALAATSPEGELEPGLARSWEDSRDGRVRTWHMRTDVRWHDGEPLTAHDVEFTLELLSDPQVSEYQFPDVAALDDSTVRISAQRHDYSDDLVIFPRHLLEDLDRSRFRAWDFWTRPVGSGPFRFVRYEPESFIEFEANPDYYRGRPRIDRVIVKFIGQAGIPEALGGSVDIVYPAEPANWPVLEGSGEFQMVSRVGSGAWVLYLDHTHPLLGDPLVRRAIVHAIDRRGIMGAIGLDPEFPLTDALYTSRQARRRQAPAPLEFDPDRAMTLLDEAGWIDSDRDGIREREGRRASFSLIARPPGRREVMIQEYLRQVGIEVEIESLDIPVIWERVYASDFDAAMHVLQPNQPWHERFFGDPEITGYSNPRVAAALDRATRTSNLDTLDALYLGIRDEFERDLPFVFLQPFTWSSFVHRRVKGLRSPRVGDPMVQMGDLWIEDR
jgi:peptide/nickel transport system substrate-binding protein